MELGQVPNGCHLTVVATIMCLWPLPDLYTSGTDLSLPHLGYPVDHKTKRRKETPLLDPTNRHEYKMGSFVSKQI
jgi:hypothetical protein